MDENENVEGIYLKDFIEESLFKQYEQLNNLELGSEEHLRASKAIAEQAKAWTEMNKVELEYNDRAAQRESDEKTKIAQAVESRKSANRGLLITAIIGTVQTVATLGAYDSWYNRGLEFEQTGAVTSGTVKNFFKSIRPNKV